MRTPWKLATSASSPPMLWKVSMWSPSIRCRKGSHPFCVGQLRRAVTLSVLVYFGGQSPILCWSTSKGSHPFCVGLPQYGVEGSSPFCVGLPPYSVKNRRQSPILCCVGPLPYSERTITHSGCCPFVKAKFASCSQMQMSKVLHAAVAVDI